MIKLKFILIAFLVFNNINAQKKSFLKDKLSVCLNYPKFISFFNICKKETDTIYINDNTKKIEEFTSIKSSCSKLLIIQKSSINIDVNEYKPNCKSEIVLYKYELRKGVYKFSFLDICSNANMVIELNSKNKIINYSTGMF